MALRTVLAEAFVNRFLPGVDPLSQSIAVDQPIPGVARNGPPVERQIVGVFQTVRDGDEREEHPEVDVPFWQTPWPMANLAFRTTADPESVTKSVAAAVRSMNSDLPISNVRTMDQVISDGRVSDRFAMVLYGALQR